MVPMSHGTIAAFLERLASDSPTPGGGSVAALTGALSAALGEMVVSLTQGRKKYAQVAAALAARGQSLERLRRSLTAAIDDDAAAYERLIAARKLPKETPEQSAFRAAAIQSAGWQAAEVPLIVARQLVEVLEQFPAIATDGNINAVSDAGVGASLGQAALLSAILNVRINLGCLQDGARTAAIMGELESLERHGHTLAEETAKIVAARLSG